MKFELVELTDFSGPKCAVYSVWVDDSDETLFAQFVRENIDAFNYEVNDILNRVEDIGFKYRAQERLFKLNEGVPGDGVSALFDDPDKNLRVYCIRYTEHSLILGGGGYKPKTIKALQEDPKLKHENYLLRDISKYITQAISEGSLLFRGDVFRGDLVIDTDDLL